MLQSTMTYKPMILQGDALTVPRAVMSPCRIYRYVLWREWMVGESYAMFIGLNPSTADETHDDPTIRRCVGFAQRWGYQALCMTNLFAYRATDPDEMKMAGFCAVGPKNDEWLKRMAENAGIIIAAWGVHGRYRKRDREVMNMLPDLSCLALTKDGHPGHPLYLKNDCRPIPFRNSEYCDMAEQRIEKECGGLL